MASAVASPMAPLREVCATSRTLRLTRRPWRPLTGGNSGDTRTEKRLGQRLAGHTERHKEGLLYLMTYDAFFAPPVLGSLVDMTPPSTSGSYETCLRAWSWAKL